MNKLNSNFNQESIVTKSEQKLITAIQVLTAGVCGGFSAHVISYGNNDVVGGLFAVACIAQIIEIPLSKMRHDEQRRKSENNPELSI